MTYKILVTGSRDWSDQSTIFMALANEVMARQADGEKDFILIHGACPTGADKIASDLWVGRQEAYPADWKTHGKKAGFVRNAEMVNLKPDICLAFIRDQSKGATMTANLAEKAGIPTRRYEQ